MATACRSAPPTRLGDVDRDDRRDRRHHLARLLLVKMEDAGQHLRLADVELAARLGLGDQPLELLGRAVRGLGVGIDAEPAQHPLRGGVEREDERPEDDDEGPHGRRDPPGEALGVLNRVELGDDLADGALEERDQHVGDHHAHDHATPWPPCLPKIGSSAWAIAGSPSAPMPIEAIVIPTWQAEM